MWLDRGELDKILAMSPESPGGEATLGPDRRIAGSGFLEQGYASFGHPAHDRDRDRYRRDDRDPEHIYGHRRGSSLGDLFGGAD